MTMKAKHRDNYVDALERDHQYAVLTKPRRIQILVEPTAKELRKRGKRGWHLYGTVDSGVDASRTLLDVVRRALAERETTDEVTGNDKAKGKKSKAKPTKTAAM